MGPLRTPAAARLGVVLAAMVIGGFAPQAAQATPKLRVVPTQYRTIQAAVRAAQPGDEVRVLPGSYREQVTIDKNLRLTGTAPGLATIRAPQALLPGEDDGRSIIEIRNGASVAISKLDISGPNAGSCASGPIESGINVLDGGHLDLGFARVIHIHDTPIARCGHNGVGVLVGNLSDPNSGSAVIHDSVISDYTTKGILVLSAGPDTITRNVVTGPEQVSSDGIDVVFSQATVSHNVVANNECRPSDPLCGPDFFNDFQHIGIFAGGPGTVIAQNLLYGNQVGMYVLDSATIRQNVLLNNDYFGIALQDGSFSVSNSRINGGDGGVAVIAASADTEATLDGVKIAGTSGAPVREFECCGFTATTIGGP
jgi:Right handed beta helix region